MPTIKVLNRAGVSLPEYQTSGSAGADIKSSEDGEIKPREIKLVGTGLFFEIPIGYEVQVRPRSGLAIKHGVTLLNSPGTIDSDYRGELKLIMINHSDKVFEYKNGERIAQIVLAKCERAKFEAVDSLSDTERSEGGFGSTSKRTNL